MEALSDLTIQSLLNNWGLQALAVQQVREVYQVQTQAGPICFKEVREKAGKLQFIAQALRHLESRGFSKMAAFRLTLAGQPYVIENNKFYIVTTWLEGQEPSYSNPVQIGATARTLAEFHIAAENFVVQGEAEAKVKVDKWNQKLKKQLIELVDFCSQAENSDTPSAFDQLLRQNSPWLGQQALAACQMLTGTLYNQLIRQYEGKLPLCHGDTAARNFIMDGAGQAWMIDFDSMAVDLPVVDLWRLLRRTLRKTNWQLDEANNILNNYQAIRPLSKQELQVLYAFLHFPERPWRLAKRYYSGDYLEQEREKLMERMEEYLLPWQKKSSFLREFAVQYAL